jgi:hypothetical protein
MERNLMRDGFWAECTERSILVSLPASRLIMLLSTKSRSMVLHWDAQAMRCDGARRIPPHRQEAD